MTRRYGIGPALWLTATLTLTFVAGAAHAQDDAPTPVVVAPVEEREYSETRPVIGRLVASMESVVAARVGGVVETVAIEVGDRVALGDELARLDRELLAIEREVADAALAEARAGVDVAVANLDLARKAFARMERLKGSAAFSIGRFDDLESELARARSGQVEAAALVRRAEADLARADYNLTHTRVLAPFPGVVLERQAQPGQYIALGQPIATLIDAVDLEVEADLPSEFAQALEPGRIVQVTLGNGDWVDAKVRAVIPRESVSTRTRPVRLTIAGLGARAAAGQSVTVMAPAGAARLVLTVPKDAIVQAQGGWVVFVAEEGAARRRAITIGAATGERFIVLGGLKVGDMVVVRGNERLRPGQKIAPGKADTPAVSCNDTPEG